MFNTSPSPAEEKDMFSYLPTIASNVKLPIMKKKTSKEKFEIMPLVVYTITFIYKMKLRKKKAVCITYLQIPFFLYHWTSSMLIQHLHLS